MLVTGFLVGIEQYLLQRGEKIDGGDVGEIELRPQVEIDLRRASREHPRALGLSLSEHLRRALELLVFYQALDKLQPGIDLVFFRLFASGSSGSSIRLLISRSVAAITSHSPATSRSSDSIRDRYARYCSVTFAMGIS